MTSQAIRKVHSESSGRTCSEEMDAICASPWAPGGIWFPSRSRIPYPRAWSIPVPPSLVALPPMPTMNLRQPFWIADRITWPTPKVVAFIGSFSASGTRVIPAAPDISMIAVPLSGRMPYWQSTGLPMGPVTVTVSRVPPMPQARASTVPSLRRPKAGRLQRRLCIHAGSLLQWHGRPPGKRGCPSGINGNGNIHNTLLKIGAFP